MAATDPAPEMVDRPAFVDDDFVFVARRVEADAESARWERNRKQALVRLRAGRRVAPRLLSYYHIDATSVRTETALRRRSWAYDRQAHLRRFAKSRRPLSPNVRALYDLEDAELEAASHRRATDGAGPLKVYS